MDIYAFISLTNVKYLVFKIEQRLNPVKVNASERHLRQIFDNLHRFHARMMLNPFFDLSWVKDGTALAIHEMSVHMGPDDEDDEDDVSSGSGSNSSRSS